MLSNYHTTDRLIMTYPCLFSQLFDPTHVSSSVLGKSVSIGENEMEQRRVCKILPSPRKKEQSWRFTTTTSLAIPRKSNIQYMLQMFKFEHVKKFSFSQRVVICSYQARASIIFSRMCSDCFAFHICSVLLLVVGNPKDWPPAVIARPISDVKMHSCCTFEQDVNMTSIVKCRVGACVMIINCCTVQ